MIYNHIWGRFFFVFVSLETRYTQASELGLYSKRKTGIYVHTNSLSPVSSVCCPLKFVSRLILCYRVERLFLMLFALLSAAAATLEGDCTVRGQTPSRSHSLYTGNGGDGEERKESFGRAVKTICRRTA